MLVALSASVTGLILLLWSADKLVDVAAMTATRLRVEPVLVGALVIGLGTSLPELAISSLASLHGNPGLAIGNAFGSNITNIALVLGIAVLLSPLRVSSYVFRRYFPILLAATALVAWQLWDQKFTRLDGFFLLVVFGATIGMLVWEAMQNRVSIVAAQPQPVSRTSGRTTKRTLFWFFVSLIVLILGSQILIWGAVGLARIFQVNDLVIGLTVVAVGTSLPELASAIAASRKGENDLILGNILGSNLFNTLAVIGCAGAIHPFTVFPEMLKRDLPVLGIATLFLFLRGYSFRGRERILTRFTGVCFLSGYSIYVVYLFMI